MKILVTSGGTKVKIDSVRHIGNMSSGTFGSRIAQCLALDNSEPDVTFLNAKGSKKPMIQDRNRHKDIEYEDFYDYAAKLEKLCKQKESFDIVILAAAVSDYLVENPVEGKIRSKDELVIKLKPAPKLISKVREWNPTCKLVGFKLLVNSTDEQLIEAARDSIIKNDCDIVIANDLRDIKNNDHTVRIVRKGVDKVETYHAGDRDGNPHYLANCVVQEILK